MLEYAPRRPWVRRRWKRLTLIMLLLAVAMAAWWWRRDIAFAWKRSEYLRAQERCLAFGAEAGRVAYEEDPVHAGQVLASDRDYLGVKAQGHDGERTLALWWPRAVVEFPDAYRYVRHTGPKALLFLHERTTPKGRRVLVCVTMYVRAGQPLSRLTFDTRVSDPATWGKAPGIAGGLVGVVDNVWYYYSTKPVRIYAGRADPGDPSRFTMEYEILGKRGVIEGRVTDADDYDGTPRTLPTKVEMSAREGDPRR